MKWERGGRNLGECPKWVGIRDRRRLAQEGRVRAKPRGGRGSQASGKHSRLKGKGLRDRPPLKQFLDSIVIRDRIGKGSHEEKEAKGDRKTPCQTGPVHQGRNVGIAERKNTEKAQIRAAAREGGVNFDEKESPRCGNIKTEEGHKEEGGVIGSKRGFKKGAVWSQGGTKRGEEMQVDLWLS